mgnify:FL=1
MICMGTQYEKDLEISIACEREEVGAGILPWKWNLEIRL